MAAPRGRVSGAMAAVAAITAIAGFVGCRATPAPSAAPSAPPTGSQTSAAPASSPSPLIAPTAEKLHWRDCGAFECLELAVPLDYEDPARATISLALLRHPATDHAHRVGSIVINPGGPGGSGVDAVTANATRFTPEVMQRFDIVGFDPRGVGLSAGVHCLAVRPTPNEAFPTDAMDVAKWADAAKTVAAACQANSGQILPYVGTENVVADLDRIRAALGEETLTYVGSSYGTLIGALYAQRFPMRIRAMVLDAPVDPSLDLEQFVSGQAAASQRQLDEFLATCAHEGKCAFHSDGDTRAAFDSLMERFGHAPIDGVSAQVAWGAVYWELASDNRGRLASDLEMARLGDATSLEQDGGWMFEPAGLDSYEAVSCADFAAPRTPEAFAQMATEAARNAPEFGPVVAYGYFDCAYWPFESNRIPGRVTAEGAPPILVLAGTGDPATPYEWGESLANQLSSGILVTRDGAGHTSLEDWCVAQIAASYLLNLTTPEAGITCQ